MSPEAERAPRVVERESTTPVVRPPIAQSKPAPEFLLFDDGQSVQAQQPWTTRVEPPLAVEHDEKRIKLLADLSNSYLGTREQRVPRSRFHPGRSGAHGGHHQCHWPKTPVHSPRASNRGSMSAPLAGDASPRSENARYAEAVMGVDSLAFDDCPGPRERAHVSPA